MTHRSKPPATADLPLWKKLLFALLAMALFYAAVELLLAALGVAPASRHGDPYVGFSSSLPLFVEQERGGETVMVTAPNKLRLFNPQQFPRRKPAGAYRVFCMGGSTTFGRPYDDATSFCGWLRQLLPAADPSRRWEVINAGGVSYASYRVALLMEELAAYDPDLFVVYTGHNEFLERRTYGRIRELPAAVRTLGALASRSRAATVVQRGIERLLGRDDAGAGRPAAGQDGAPPSDGEAGNVLAGEVVTLLDRSVGPQEYHRDEALARQVLEHFRFSLERIVEIGRDAGAEVVLVTPASDLRSCAPFKSEHRDGLGDAELARWQARFDAARAALAAGDAAAALAALDAAAALDDRYAELHFLRGRALWELARYAEAKSAFERARDEDVCPLRALGPMPGIVAEVAEERGAPLVDFVALLAARAEGGVPGDDLFYDHVHPTIAGHRLLALALVDELAAQGVVRFAPGWGEEAVARVVARVESGLDRRAHAMAQMKLSKVLGWAGKLAESCTAARRAVALAPEIAEVQYQAGICAQLTGRLDEAVDAFRRAVADNPRAAEPQASLAAALEAAGELAEAVEHFRRAVALHDGDPSFYRQRLALALARLGGEAFRAGRLEEAATHLTEATALRPGDGDAQYQLGQVLLALGRAPAAVAPLRAAAARLPAEAGVRLRLAQALVATGDRAGAVAEARAAVRLDPALDPARQLLASLLHASGASDEAVAVLREAIVGNFGNVATHRTVLGSILFARGDRAAARDEFVAALAAEPNLMQAASNLAWILATSTDPRLRDGAEAVRRAQHAVDLTGGAAPSALDVLAAAYAEAGRFPDAVSTAERARALAAAAGNDALVQAIDGRLALYRAGRPYREP